MSGEVGKVSRKVYFDLQTMGTQGSVVSPFNLFVCKQVCRSLVGLQ